jgi:putative membrane protein
MGNDMKKRLHPFRIVLSILQTLKNLFFPAVFLFIFHSASEAQWVIIGRIGLLLYIVISLIAATLTWWTYRYKFRERTLQVYSGVFVKSERNVPIERIQNVQKHTSFLHKLLRMTSLTLETGTGGDEASVKLDMITFSESARIESLLNQGEEEKRVERTVHFTVSRHELIKASFTSLSFFAIIPLLASLYFTIDDFFKLNSVTKVVIDYVTGTLWVLAPISVGLLIFGAAAGVITTYLRYGNFEISSDEERIYLKKGVLNESLFTITKEKVQAVTLNQSLLKRWLGLVEVELISAGSVGDEELETNSLYPFLPVKQAASLVEDLLPAYKMEKEMKKLPWASLWIKLMRPSWLWLIATIVLIWWKPQFWYASPGLLVIILLMRLLVFSNSRYNIEADFLYMKTGAFSTVLLVTSRQKIQEIEVKNSFLQRKWKLASIKTANRGKPVHFSEMSDVPVNFANHFYSWYAARSQK